ncbi:solute carrier family 2, facilitated glucose transporter member 9-like [Carassius carassius]|uniref:solute carrier family 2, facilitated glucose transporter member 9-like n=1 Tax=Carassius carassius TaxID=217509 RepID=UPI002868909D|nr:solute carrier family 2, facilitated glucose transporter member 9-like [Carassius carassius]
MAEEVLILSPSKITLHLTSSLLAVAFLTSFGSSMLYGYNLAVVNSPAGYIKDFYNHTVVSRNGTGFNGEALTLMYSLTVSVFAIGGLIGSLMVGTLVTKFGRKGTVVNSTVLVFIAGSVMGFSRICGSPEMVIFGRFITGIHSGISLSVVPMYLGEIAPKNLRGFLGLMPSIFICAGVFSAQVLGLHELLGKEEHWPLFLSLVVTICHLYKPKSLSFRSSPQIWFYTNDIFENAGIPTPEIQYTTVGTGAIEIIAGLIGCFTIERLGRRPLIIGGFGVMGMCCAGITLSLILQTHVPFMKYVSVGCVVGIIAGFCIGPAGVPFLITAELFKQSHRPAAYTVGGSLNWMSNFTIGFIFPFLQMSAGSYCYLVFCVICLSVAIYVYFVIPETKNKTFVEISQMFATKEAVEESQALTHPDQLKLKKMNGYGSLENGSLEFDSSSSCP